MKRLAAFVLSLLLAALVLLPLSAVADDLHVTSYKELQDIILKQAYKLPRMNATLTGELFAIVPSYTFEKTYYLFIMVDPDDVSMWSTEDDNFFVTLFGTDLDTFPFAVGDTLTVSGRVAPTYSSPVCPYITCETINGVSY